MNGGDTGEGGEKLIKGEEAVATVDDVGEDDEAAKIHFFAIAVCGNVVLLASIGAHKEFQPFLPQFGKARILQIEDTFINEIQIGIHLIGQRGFGEVVDRLGIGMLRGGRKQEP